MNRTVRTSSLIDDASSKAILQPETIEEKRTTKQPSDRIGLLNEPQSDMQARLPDDQYFRRDGRVAAQLQNSPQSHLSIAISQIPESDRASSDFESSFTFFCNRLLNILWRIFDNVVLLQMGSSYLIRFHELALVAEGGNDLVSVDDWRKDQQAEWDRLSPTLGLLAAMHAAILAISPQPPNLAFSLWLGGGALSVCGLFTVQYFPIRAFSVTDEDVVFIIEKGNELFNVALIAAVVASPVVICLWTAVLFVAGMVDYIIESDLGGLRYRIFAASCMLWYFYCRDDIDPWGNY